MFFNRFCPQINWSTKHFLFDLNLELHSSLKVGGCEINFIIKSCLNQKILADLLYQFKSWNNKSRRIFWFEQLLNNKFWRLWLWGRCAAPDWGQTKILGGSGTLGVKSVEKHPRRGTFENLTTPNLSDKGVQPKALSSAVAYYRHIWAVEMTFLFNLDITGLLLYHHSIRHCQVVKQHFAAAQDSKCQPQTTNQDGRKVFGKWARLEATSLRLWARRWCRSGQKLNSILLTFQNQGLV